MTVSNALRGKGRISEDIRRRIIDVARELEYRPNHAARALRGNSSHTIGLLTGALDVDPTNVKVASFDQVAREAHYTTIMTFSPNSAVEDELIRQLMARQIDGIVVYPAEAGEHTELHRLLNEQFPVVTLDGHGRFDSTCSDISTNYFAAGQLQAAYLMETGYRALCHVNSEPNCQTKAQVRAGFIDACTRSGLVPRLIDLSIAPDSGNRIAPDMLSQLHDALDSRIDGVATYDLIALAAMRVLWEQGRRIPDDVGVIGFDDSPMTSNTFIPLTTIAQPSEAVGRRAFELIHREIQLPRDSRGQTRELSKPIVIPRMSTRF